jgi:hypothetical protein
MRCDEATKLLPGLVLGDLDAEPSALLEEHLRGCAACRAGRDALARAASAAPALAPSSERRQAAVAAMQRAHQDLSERLLARPRRRWRRAAAIVLAAALGAFLGLRGREERPWLTVSEVAGPARMLAGGARAPAPLSAGLELRAGDRVWVEGGSLRLRVEGGEMVAVGRCDLLLASGRTVMIENGLLYVQREGSALGPVVVGDTAGNSAELRAGKFEARLRNVVAPDSTLVRRLTTRVEEGEALLSGARDERLRVEREHEGTFDRVGAPFTKPTVGLAGGLQQQERTRRQLERLDVRLAGRDERGAPLYRIGDSAGDVRVEGIELALGGLEIERAAADGGEAWIPVRVRYALKK